MATTVEGPASLYVLVDAVPWEHAGPGVSVKRLWSDESTGRSAELRRIDPGARVPRHRHVDDGLEFVLEGALSDEAGTLTPGNFRFAPPGCVHEEWSGHGATVLSFASRATEAAGEGETGPPSRILVPHEVPWIERGFPGLRVKLIFADRATDRYVSYMRFAPGAVLPKHRHVGDELVFMLDGATEDEHGTVTAGNFAYRPEGCCHTLSSPNGGTTLTCVWGHIEFLDGVAPGPEAGTVVSG